MGNFIIEAETLKNYEGDDTEIIIPDNVKTIGNAAFSNCESLTSVTIPVSATSIGICVFEYCSGLRNITIPDSVTSIADGAFLGCSGLTGITIPTSVTIIADGTFSDCSSLTSITIPDSVTSIGKHAFADCSGLTSITIPASVTSIREGAFSRCSSLTSITIPASVTSIEESVFSECNSLTSVTIPDSVTSIESYAFHLSINLKSVIISNNVTYIGRYAFAYCDSLSSITIPDSVTIIGESAFRGCDSLTSIIIPDSVIEIGRDAFFDCLHLSRNSVKLPNPFTDITTCSRLGLGDENGCAIKDDTLIRHVREDAVLYVTEGVVTIAKEAFPYTNRIKQIVLPDSVQLIEDNRVFQQIEEMNIPKGYLQQIKALPIGSTTVLLTKVWEKKATLFDYTCLYLLQKPKAIVDICQKKLAADPDESVKLFVSVPQMKKKKTSFNLAAEFLMRHVHSVSPENIKAFYDFAVSAKATEAAERVKPAVDAIPSDEEVLQNGGDRNSENEQAKLQDLNLADFNISGDTLLAYLGSEDQVTVPFGIVEIAEGGLYRKGKRFAKVTLPDTVRNIHKNAFIVPVIAMSRYDHVPTLRDQRMRGMPGSMNIPEGYFTQTKGAYDLDMALLLLCGPWENEATFKDYVKICANQTNRALLDLCFERFSSNPSEAMDMLIVELEKSKLRDFHERTAHFALENISSISQEQISRLLNVSKKAGATDAVTLLKQYMPKESSPKDDERMNPVEEELRKKHNLYDLDMVLKKAVSMDSYWERCVFDDFDYSGVKYADSDEEVSTFVLKYVIAAYVEQLEARPKRGRWYCGKFSFDAAADKVAATFDKKSFQNLIDRIELCHETVAVKCRYGSEKELVHIRAVYNKRGKESNPSFNLVAEEAFFLSDTRRGMIIADEMGELGRYAKMRKTTATFLRETKIFDFGLDEHGDKYYDIGSTIIKATLNRDFSFTLFDMNAGKEVRSIPKRNADPEKLQEASDDLADLKKNIRKVISNKKKELFPVFLGGATLGVREWKQRYLPNPVFRRLAESLVWEQAGGCFTLTADNVIRSDSSQYEIRNDAPISIAHPLEMDPAETAAWQKYFTAHSIKQPFAQIWEPTPLAEKIKPDRYKGCMIEYCRFLSREEHGITVEDYDFHNEIDISLRDCDAEIKRIDWHRHEISMSDRFEIEAIAVTNTASRMANHVIAYLDRITIYERIKKDDPSIADQLKRCNVAQITDYIRAAQEANATNVLALLLDYKNKNYANVNPMEEFVLDW